MDNSQTYIFATIKRDQSTTFLNSYCSIWQAFCSFSSSEFYQIENESSHKKSVWSCNIEIMPVCNCISSTCRCASFIVTNLLLWRSSVIPMRGSLDQFPIDFIDPQSEPLSIHNLFPVISVNTALDVVFILIFQSSNPGK